MSIETQTNWLIDAAVFSSALLASFSGVYFLFIPSGGYQGGRNPMYGVTFLVRRATWSDLHTWTGVVMIAAVAVHFTLHWSWVNTMAKRVIQRMRHPGSGFSRGARVNVLIDAVIALSFLICALSGLYFLYGPTGGYQGGSNPGWDPGFLFSRSTWDVLHTWSGVVMIVAAVLHFAIHWGWVKKVTARFFSLAGARTRQVQVST